RWRYTNVIDQCACTVHASCGPVVDPQFRGGLSYGHFAANLLPGAIQSRGANRLRVRAVIEIEPHSSTSRACRSRFLCPDGDGISFSGVQAEWIARPAGD